MGTAIAVDELLAVPGGSAARIVGRLGQAFPGADGYRVRQDSAEQVTVIHTVRPGWTVLVGALLALPTLGLSLLLLLIRPTLVCTVSLVRQSGQTGLYLHGDLDPEALWRLQELIAAERGHDVAPPPVGGRPGGTGASSGGAGPEVGLDRLLGLPPTPPPGQQAPASGQAPPPGQQASPPGWESVMDPVAEAPTVRTAHPQSSGTTAHPQASAEPPRGRRARRLDTTLPDSARFDVTVPDTALPGRDAVPGGSGSSAGGSGGHVADPSVPVGGTAGPVRSAPRSPGGGPTPDPGRASAPGHRAESADPGVGAWVPPDPFVREAPSSSLPSSPSSLGAAPPEGPLSGGPLFGGAASAAPLPGDALPGDARPSAPAGSGSGRAEERTVRRPAMAAVASGPGQEPVLVFDTGETVPLVTSVLVGRDPARSAGDGADVVLVPIEDPQRSVSKTHLAVGRTPGGVWVADRHSTNGVEIVDGGASRRLVPGERVEARRGAVIRFGDRTVTIR